MPSPLLRAKVLATAANLQWELGQQAGKWRHAAGTWMNNSTFYNQEGRFILQPRKVDSLHRF
jgi:hypothetical protein